MSLLALSPLPTAPASSTFLLPLDPRHRLPRHCSPAAGTLKTVAEGGSFRQPGVSAKNGPACPALVPLYTSLLEVALALRHLHARRLVHCDVSACWVLGVWWGWGLGAGAGVGLWGCEGVCVDSCGVWWYGGAGLRVLVVVCGLACWQEQVGDIMVRTHTPASGSLAPNTCGARMYDNAHELPLRYTRGVGSRRRDLRWP